MPFSPHINADEVTITDIGSEDDVQYDGYCGYCGIESGPIIGYFDNYEDEDYNINHSFFTIRVSTIGDRRDNGMYHKIYLCPNCRHTHATICEGHCRMYFASDQGFITTVTGDGVEYRSICIPCYYEGLDSGHLARCGYDTSDTQDRSEIYCGTIVNSGQLRHEIGADVYCDVHSSLLGIIHTNHETPEHRDRLVSNLAIGPEDQRPFSRTCSFEMEMMGEYEPLMSRLCDAGWCDGVQNPYHSSGRTGYPIHFEYDATVETEMIFPYLNMNYRSPSLHVLRNCVKEVQSSVDKGEVQFTLKTGLHVHLDAHQFHPMHMRNLYLLWCYIEDVMFRFGSVGYRCHRLLSGNTHATKMEKGSLHELVDNPMMFGGVAGRMTSHASSMNFANYISNNIPNLQGSDRTCNCGAIAMGMHEKCTCNLGKNTIEFRVPNGTSSLNKIYSYLFLFTNLMNVAQFHPNAVKALGKLQHMEYTDHSPVKGDRGKYKKRLKWMAENLCYTDNEREALASITRKSEIVSSGVITTEFADSLVDTKCVLPGVDSDINYDELRNYRFPRLERS
jgi:hypothetical protein